MHQTFLSVWCFCRFSFVFGRPRKGVCGLFLLRDGRSSTAYRPAVAGAPGNKQVKKTPAQIKYPTPLPGGHLMKRGLKHSWLILLEFNPKNFMAFRPYKGRFKYQLLPVTTSTALLAGNLVECTSGLVAAADTDEAAVDVRGVLAKTIASTDSDYATARSVSVIVPMEKHCVWEADTGGSFVATDIGVEYGITASGTAPGDVVDRTETTADTFLMTEFVSASKIRGYLKINGSY